MTEQEQAATFLRTWREHQSLSAELAAIEADLKTFGKALKANADILGKSPDLWRTDADTLCLEVQKAAKQVARLRDLQAEIATNRAALEKFGENFPALKYPHGEHV